MDGEAGPPVSRRIIGFDQRRLAFLHRRKIKPFMRRVEPRHLDLPDAVLRLPRDLDQVAVGQCCAVTKGKRTGLDRAGDGTPDIDDGKAVHHQFIRLVGKDVAKPLFRRPLGVVVMDHRGWLAHGLRPAKPVACRAAGVVENDNAARTRHSGDQVARLCLIDGGQRGIIMKITHRAVMPDQHETGMVQIKDAAAAVPDLDLAVIILAIMLGGVSACLRGVIDGIAAIRRQILQAGTNTGLRCGHVGFPFPGNRVGLAAQVITAGRRRPSAFPASARRPTPQGSEQDTRSPGQCRSQAAGIRSPPARWRGASAPPCRSPTPETTF